MKKESLLKKINRLFNRRQKAQFRLLFILMILGALLETLSVSLVVPVMAALTGAAEGSGLGSLLHRFLPGSSETYMVSVLVIMILLFLFKNLFLSFQCWVQSRFINSCQIKTRRKLLEYYLHMPYEFFLNAESGELIRTVNDDADGAYTLVSRVLAMAVELIVSVAIFLVLLIIEPKITLFLAVLLTVEVLVISLVIDPVSKRLAVVYRKNIKAANSWVIQAFRGIKEIIVMRREDYFVSQFGHHSAEAYAASTKAAFLSLLPRNFIEAATMSGMLLYFLFYYLHGNDVNALVPQLSAFVVAAVRLIPSFNRISNAKNNIAFCMPRLDSVLEKLAKLEEATDAPATKETFTLQDSCGLKEVTYIYPNMENPVLQNADMVIPAGKAVGIIGPSGAGKTTAVDLLLNLLVPQSGTVYADGKDTGKSRSSWLSHIGYIPQTIFLMNRTILENVAFGVPEEEIDENKAEEALRAASLLDFVKSLPMGIRTSVGEGGVRLSGGQRQRIGIARALYTDPELLVFDEATSSLDTETENDVMESIRALHGQKTEVIIAHRLSTIEHCDLVYRVEEGKITLLKDYGNK